VREATLALVNEGLLEPVRNRGFRVVELGEADLDEVYELRVLLEVPAMRTVAHRHATIDLADSRALAADVSVAAENGDLHGFLDLDRELHLGLLTLAGNSRLVAIVASLRLQTRLFGLAQVSEPKWLTAAADEHHRILDAVDAGDADEVARVMRVHLAHTRGSWFTGEEEA
jgi:DNA-binding GntR family transcriptional regulator